MRSSTFLPQLNPPAPTSAIYTGAPRKVEVFWDHALDPVGAIDKTNWAVVIDGIPAVITTATALADRVRLDLGLGGGLNGDNTVSYAPPPFDVVGTQGAPAPAFALFPVT